MKQGHVSENIVVSFSSRWTALSKTTFLEQAVNWLSSKLNERRHGALHHHRRRTS
ncbi:hypothetical protein ACEQPO_30215 [Bacillus sp. SL00103]